MRQLRFWATNLTGLLLLLCSLQLWAAAGKVEFVSGSVVAISNAGTRPLQKGSDVNASDLIDTQASGRAQIRFSDGAYLSLAPNTKFRIDRYKFNGSNDGEETGFFSLLKGSFRTISGLIGKGKKEAYQVTTQTATIGIRGTEYTAEENNGLKVMVHKGAVLVTNDAGSTLVPAGTQIFVPAKNKPAQIIKSGTTASGPLKTPSTLTGLPDTGLEGQTGPCIETTASVGYPSTPASVTARSCNQF
ncbi:FecR family protein [Leeia oryzae]|uniref:FecR family protein n=1 Tax=Leeia oryzae TaxID=356662 RepID=UPI000368608C|nr:FecR domain-containing protein [Leeia oryzae]